MHFLLRFAEIGKEPHASKSKARQDILACLRAAAPGARVVEETVGRIVVEAEEDLSALLARLHGLSSYSPCVRCGLDELGERAVELARGALEGKSSFAVRVRQAGCRVVSSRAKAAEIGERVLEAMPRLAVDLTRPEVTIHVEIRESACYLFHAILPGIDRRGEAPRRPGGEPRFLVDAMLGTLASRLRALGFDTVCYHDTADSVLLREAKEEGRVILTQDRELAALGGPGAHFVAARTLDGALDEVVRAFGLEPSEASLFTRCSVCNAPLEAVAKELVRDRVPPRVREQIEEFHRCPACGKIYWKGRHYEQMMADLFGRARER
ncbi:MAG: hypothetical protein IT372_29240 [Polyangiaceae bacterium]|nr:hypothetical protein [Polyangiaceae bacterium]